MIALWAALVSSAMPHRPKSYLPRPARVLAVYRLTVIEVSGVRLCQGYVIGSSCRVDRGRPRLDAAGRAPTRLSCQALGRPLRAEAKARRARRHFHLPKLDMTAQQRLRNSVWGCLGGGSPGGAGEPVWPKAEKLAADRRETHTRRSLAAVVGLPVFEG